MEVRAMKRYIFAAKRSIFERYVWWIVGVGAVLIAASAGLDLPVR